MNYAHSKRILHRDLKPSNVMVGPYGETLIVDWGLAKQMDVPDHESMTFAFLRDRNEESGSTPTQVGGAIGTPQYMSPEQAGGRVDEVGRCTDIYLLGGILYQILTGRPPHREESLSSLLSKVAQGKFTPPRSIDPDISKPLDAICCKAMNARCFEALSFGRRDGCGPRTLDGRRTGLRLPRRMGGAGESMGPSPSHTRSLRRRRRHPAHRGIDHRIGFLECPTNTAI